MIPNSYLSLVIDGNEIRGDSVVSSMERAHSINCISYNAENGKGNRFMGSVTITKYLDRSSVLLTKALSDSISIDSAKFRFFRPLPSGGGQEELFYTVDYEIGRIVSSKQYTEPIVSQSSEPRALVEEVEFRFKKATWTYEIGGVTFQR